MFNQILKSLGWSDKVTKLYLSLLKNGSLIVSDIAKYSKINRVTVYDTLKKLIEEEQLA